MKSKESGNPVIFSPTGQVIGSRASERVELRAGIGEWLRQFADVAQALKLGVHCSLCGGDLTGKNSDSDPAYAMSCGCRDFVWKNRDYRESTPQKVN